MSKPLYLKIKNDLLAAINSGHYNPHTPLPSEYELAEHYQVSRITSKRALDELEREGKVVRKRGLGTFVITHNTRHTSNDLLLISPFSNAPEFGNYTQGILNALEGSNYRLHVSQNEAWTRKRLEVLKSQYAGIIFYPLNNEALMTYARYAHVLNVPTVILDKEIAGIPLPCVLSNNLQGGLLATQHILEKTHDNIAFLSATDIEHASSVRERYFGYLRAMSQTTTQSELAPIMWNFNADKTTKKALLDALLAEGIHSVVCENDSVAMSFMNTARSLGYAIPNDFKVVGFDNTTAAAYMEPPLTTIQQDFIQIGYQAATLLQHLITDQPIPQRTVIDVSLVERASTA